MSLRKGVALKMNTLSQSIWIIFEVAFYSQATENFQDIYETHTISRIGKYGSMGSLQKFIAGSSR